MRKLLIIDDSEDLLYAMEHLLSSYGFAVRTTNDKKHIAGEIELFRPDIVIIDVLLGGENGRDLCKKLREDTANDSMTIILFSASPKHLEDFEECNADGAIEKPFGLKELIGKIEMAEHSRKNKVAGRGIVSDL